MTNYLHLLNNLDPKFSLASTTASKLAFVLSGQSSFHHSNLSEDQLKLLSIVEQHGYRALKSNFPYNQHFSSSDHEPSILSYSLRNIYQYILSLSTPQYSLLVAKHLQPIFDNHQDILIISYSMGLQMLSLAFRHLHVKPKSNIRIFAMGPVCNTKFVNKVAHLIVIKGKQDWISKNFDKQTVDHYVNTHHMGYCKDQESQQIFKNYLSSL